MPPKDIKSVLRREKIFDAVDSVAYAGLGVLGSMLTLGGLAIYSSGAKLAGIFVSWSGFYLAYALIAGPLYETRYKKYLPEQLVYRGVKGLVRKIRSKRSSQATQDPIEALGYEVKN